MADLLTHVLVPFVLVTVIRWRVDGIDRRWIPVAMGGAAVPDLGKVGIILDDSSIEAVLGIPFSWAPMGTMAGVVIITAAIAVWFESDQRVAYGWLVFGGLSALVLDGLRAFADGSAGFWLYPLWWRPPTPNWYVSSDYRVTLIAIAIAGAVLLLDRWWLGRQDPI